jgi:formyl-CoA transferase
VDDVIDILEGSGLPHSLVYSVDDILADPHYAARGSIASLDHPKIGALKMPAPSPRMSGTPACPMNAAPRLGEHNDEVYGSLLGLDAEAIASLQKNGLI